MQYLLYDTAINELYSLLQLQQTLPQYESLFKGTDDENLLDVAPFIFSIDEPLPQTILSNSNISLQHIILLESKKTLEDICKHFREFIYQKVNGQNHYFRFWDARVMKKYLSSCEEWQLQAFLEDIKTVILIESIDVNEYSCFEYNRNGLQHITLTLEEMMIKTKQVFSKNLISTR